MVAVEVGGDPGCHAHPVVAGLRRLVGVAEVGRVHRVLGVARRGGRDLTGVREERDVAAAARAARAGHVGEAEAPDAGGVVVVAAGGRGTSGVAPGVLRAPGEHAERDDRAREDIAAVSGADERIDVRGGVLDQGVRGVAVPPGAASVGVGVPSARAAVSSRDVGRTRMTRPLLVRTGRAPQVAQAAGTVTCASATTGGRSASEETRTPVVPAG